MKNRIFVSLIVTSLSMNLWAESRTVEAFSEIAYPLPYDIEFVAGSEYRVDFEGDQDTIEEIETKVTAGTLQLSKNSSWFDWSDGKVSVTITYVKLDGITLSGSGEGFAKTLDADKFSIRVNGSAGLEVEQLTGNTLDLNIAGSGNLNLYNISADSIRARIAGSGNMELTGNTVSQTVNITGSGDYNARELRS